MFDLAAIFSTHAHDLPFRLLSMAVVMAVAGWTFAVLMRLLGDPGPTYDGRRTLNPLSHLDWGGLFAGTIFRFGWIRPFGLRPAPPGRAWPRIALAVAGTVAVLLLLAVLLDRIAPLFLGIWDGSLRSRIPMRIANTTAEMAVWIALVNLIPLPPFLAGHIWAALWPRGWDGMMRRFWLVSLVALVIVASGLPSQWLTPVAGAARRMLGI